VPQPKQNEQSDEDAVYSGNK